MGARQVDEETIRRWISENSGGSSYLIYVALLNQSGTNDPVATVLQNTLGGDVVWTRFTNGGYTGTLAGAFTAAKTVVFVTSSGAGQIDAAIDSPPNTVYVDTYDAAGNREDGDLSNTSIEIRVYA